MIFNNDNAFEECVLPQFRMASARHWIPLNACETVAKWLACFKDINILDIGSGVGKFCFLMSRLAPTHSYVGVEINNKLIEEAHRLQRVLKAENCDFIHSSFDELDFTKYDAFFFFNSFYEQLVNHGSSFGGRKFHRDTFNLFNDSLIKKLSLLKKGSIFISYQGYPEGLDVYFKLEKKDLEKELILWTRN